MPYSIVESSGHQAGRPIPISTPAVAPVGAGSAASSVTAAHAFRRVEIVELTAMIGTYNMAACGEDVLGIDPAPARMDLEQDQP
jgi:hypothetical protein